MTTVAEVLKREREVQGISLEEVAQKTYIKLHYLHALEEDRPDLLPAPVYTCGYIRQYAKLLGLNGAELVTLYQQQSKPREYSIVRNVAPALGETEIKAPQARPDTDYEMGQDLPEMSRQPAPAPVPAPVKVIPAPTPVASVAAAPSAAPLVMPAARPTAPTFSPSAPAANAPLEVRIDTRDALLAHPDAEKLLTLARQQADEILAKARDEAAKLRQGAEHYADQVLLQLETEVSRSLAIIKNGRTHLQTRQRSRRVPDRIAERIAEPPVL